MAKARENISILISYKNYILLKIKYVSIKIPLQNQVFNSTVFCEVFKDLLIFKMLNDYSSVVIQNIKIFYRE